ncbi:hypothetical protein D7V88_42070, partial [Corallococcus terminator]
MKRKVAVCVGVWVAVAGGVAHAQEPQAPVSPAKVAAAVVVADPKPVSEAPSGTETQAAPVVAAPVTVLSAAPLVEAATGGEPAQAAVAQRSEPEEIRVPAVLMVMPHVSTAGTDTGRLVTTFAVGLLGTHAKRVDGLAMSM